MNLINVGLCGLGTVGGGTFDVLQRNADIISQRAGKQIRITHVAARDLPSDLDLSSVKVSSDVMEVARDPNVQVLVELIGGYQVAYELVMEAIRHGKHVVTANKALIAVHGNEIFAAAKEQGVIVAFEASVAGGIPVIKALREGLTANEVQWLAGIINGTGNFILTEMRDNQSPFEAVLAQAQALGYAEADPTFDVEGIDAAHKLTILASIAFSIPLQFKKVYTEGITKITAEDVRYAQELGYEIKHLGIARRTVEGVEMRVHPTLVPKSKLLADVDGVLNAVMVQGDAVGPTLYNGPGAGREPTASAVIADLVDVARQAGTGYRLPPLGVEQLNERITVLPMSEVVSGYYLRILVDDRVGVMASVADVMRENNINIEAIIQKEPNPDQKQVTLVLLIQEVKEKQMDAALEQLQQLPEILDAITRIRVEGLGS